MLAVALLEQGRPAEAEAALRDAIRLGADDTATLVNLGHALMMQARPTDALVPYGRAVSADPGAAHARYAWGLALHDTGRRDEATEQFCEAARIEPENPDYREACGR